MHCEYRNWKPGDAEGCEAVLRSVPEWFGIEESLRGYLRRTEELFTLVATADDSSVVGFCSLEETSAHAMDVHVLAVARGMHDRGIGRGLVDRCADHARAAGKRFLTVKTLGPSEPDPNYARTRGFYERVGFLPLEELSGLWPGFTTLLLVRVLDADGR